MQSLKDIISVLKDKDNAKYASKIEIQFSGLPKKKFCLLMTWPLENK